MSSVYHFLPWLREGLASRLRAPRSDEDSHRGRLDVTATLNEVPLDLPTVSVLGPGDVRAIDPAQVVRTEPVAGATGFEVTGFACVDLDSPTLPWLFTPLPAEGDRLTPWLCLIVVRQQDGVSLSVNVQRGTTELTVARPSDAAALLPDLANAWAWAHVQVSGGLDEGQSLGHVISAFPERVVSRLICPTPLRADSRYVACVVPTFAVGRDAGLGRPPAPGLGWAWTAADHELTLPVYYHWEFATGTDTGAGADFAALVGALRFQRAPAGLGERDFDVAGSGLDGPADADGMPPFVGALCSPDTAHRPAPAWVQAELAPLVGGATTANALPLYAGEPAGARSVAATESGWLAELNLDPRHRAVAALGAAVVRDRQEQLAAAAWAQLGEIESANQLTETGRVAHGIGTSLVARHLATVPDDRTLAQMVAPLQRTASAEVSTTTTLRRIARPRGPFARRAAAATGPEPTADDRPTMLGLVDSARTVTRRIRDRISFTTDAAGANAAAFARSGFGRAESGDPDAPLVPVAVAPSYPTPMAGELARIAPQFLLPGAHDIPADTVVALRTNPRFVAAFLAGLNTELARELRWREFPLDGTATYFQQFWDRRGQGGAAGPDIAPIGEWPRHQQLHETVTGAGAQAQVVLVIRGELLRRFPRSLVYAIRAVNPTTLADESTSDNLSYPTFGGWIEPDIRYFGFALSIAAATASPGWFFAFQEQPTETRFGPPPGGAALPGPEPSSAAVAQRALRLPVRVIVHASTLLAPPPSPSTGDAHHD